MHQTLTEIYSYRDKRNRHGLHKWKSMTSSSQSSTFPNDEDPLEHAFVEEDGQLESLQIRPHLLS